MVGVELVADRATRAPFPRSARVTEAVVRGARERGVLVYSGTGNADGTNGDTILLGPPFVVTDEELRADRRRRWPTPIDAAVAGAAPVASGGAAGSRRRRRRSAALVRSTGAA